MERGNLNLGNQEQMEVIPQPTIFGKPDVSKNIAALSGTMNMHDANGVNSLLPNGGNWADFATRMGYKEVPSGSPGAMTIKSPDGKAHNYAIDPNAKGSISDYFTQNAAGPRAATNNAGNPAPLYPATTSFTGQRADSMAQNLNQGNYFRAAADTISIPFDANLDAANGAINWVLGR